MPNHLLDIKSLSVNHINEILATTRTILKTNLNQTSNTPATLLLFKEPSTRTLLSFQRACQLINSPCSVLDPSTSSIQKGETIEDTIRTIEALGFNILVIRTPNEFEPHTLANVSSKLSIINAGDGTNEHPTQALLDLYTLEETLGDVKGKKITIVGDILHARVAHSNAWILTKKGAQVVLCGPEQWLQWKDAPPSCQLEPNLQKAVKDASAIIVMRIQKERFKKTEKLDLQHYIKHWQITISLLEKAGNPWLMHPGPFNRGIELQKNLPEHYPKTLIWKQVSNGVLVRAGILKWILQHE